MKGNPKSEIRKPKEVRRPKEVRVRQPRAMPGVEPGGLAECFRQTREELGRSIGLERWSRQWTRGEFARRTGLTVAEVRELEDGWGEINLSTLLRVALALGGTIRHWVARGPKEGA